MKGDIANAECGTRNAESDSDPDKPVISLIDLQRGWKQVTVTLKSGEEHKIQMHAVNWEELGAIHLEHGRDQAKVERAVLEKSLPQQISPSTVPPLTLQPFAWLDWLDIDSRNLVTRVAREFAYGFSAEKKRNEAIRQISRLLSARSVTAPSNASDSDSATPSPGVSPSSESSSDASAKPKPTIV